MGTSPIRLLAKLAGAARRRPGTPPIPSPDAVASLERIDLNGYPQWILVRGRDRRKPLLVFLHGGPGGAAMAHAHASMRTLEEHFVCVNWDQRGAGKSFDPGPDPATMGIEQFVADAVALIERLRERFDAPKVLLVGHSWGSVLSMKIATRRPDLVRGLVGMGQVVSMLRGETISYQYALDQARAEGNRKAVRALERIGPPPHDAAALFEQRRWLSRYHGDLHTMDLSGFLSIAADAPEYTLGDLVRLLRGLRRSCELVWPELMTVDFLRDVPKLSVPVAFFEGRYDRNVPHELVVELLEKLEAPSKEIVWFEGSAHMPNIEEPERFQRELLALAAKWP